VIYRLSVKDSGGRHIGFKFYAHYPHMSRDIRAINATKEDYCITTEEFRTPEDKKEMVEMLNAVAVHPDNR
jgi:hypothetical protein